MMTIEPMIRKRATGLFAAGAVALLCMTVLVFAGTAEGKPFDGYRFYDDNFTGKYVKEVSGSGSVVLWTYDRRGVTPAKWCSYVWSNNTYLCSAYKWDVDEETPTDYGPELRRNKVLKKMHLKGVSYSRKTNTLTLNNVKLPKYTLVATAMGNDFKIKIKGKNSLAGIECRQGAYYRDAPRPRKSARYVGDWSTGLRLCGTGTLTVGKNGYHSTPITVGIVNNIRFVVEKHVKLRVYASGTGNAVQVWSLGQKPRKGTAKKAITFKGRVKTKLLKKSYENYKGYKCIIANSKLIVG